MNHSSGRWLLFWCTALWLSGDASAQPPLRDLDLGDNRTSQAGMPYLLDVPEGEPPTDGHPVLLFLHGGDRSNTRNHPKGWAATAEITLPLVYIAPLCTGACSWSALDAAALLDEVAREVVVDPERIYVTGYSMGGFGTWSVLSRSPERFAAGVPIAGGGEPESICAARRVAIRAYHGDRDPIIEHSRSVEMVEALERCDGHAKLITFEGVEHGSWAPVYRDPEFWQWLLEQRRR